jgi:hypothetical protein
MLSRGFALDLRIMGDLKVVKLVTPPIRLTLLLHSGLQLTAILSLHAIFLFITVLYKKGDSVAENDGTLSIHACVEKLRPPSPEISDC